MARERADIQMTCLAPTAHRAVLIGRRAWSDVRQDEVLVFVIRDRAPAVNLGHTLRILHPPWHVASGFGLSEYLTC